MVFICVVRVYFVGVCVEVVDREVRVSSGINKCMVVVFYLFVDEM